MPALRETLTRPHTHTPQQSHTENTHTQRETRTIADGRCCAGANFRAKLTFPTNYPIMPPVLVFQKPVPFHPNVYPSGALCISILHPPEEDQYGYEAASERWSPVQTPETILISVISLFASPNDESPANVEAARLLRDERVGKNKDFRNAVRKCVRESLGEE